MGAEVKKKINPKDQTEELNRVKLEFLKRNPEEWQKLEELIQRNENKRGEFLDNLGGICNAESRDAWDFLMREKIFDKELENKIKEIEIPPAVNATYPFMQFGIDVGTKVMVHGGDDIFHMSEDTKNDKYLDYLCLHAREIFTELTSGNPCSCLLVGIDLRRGKDVIFSELENLPKLHNLNQIKMMATILPEKRLKWLPIVDELTEVWDLYDQAGKQPVKITFMQIKRKVNRPLSTVKDQWRMAYELIYDKPYDPESKYATEEKKQDAAMVCQKCPHLTAKGAKCQRGSEWIPCSEYLKIAGKEKSNQTKEYMDDMSNDLVEERWQNELESKDDISFEGQDLND